MVENKNIVLRQFSTTTTTTHTRLCCRCSRRRLLSDWRITSNASSVVFSHFLVVDCVLKESQREEEKKKRDRDRLSLFVSSTSLAALHRTPRLRARALHRTHVQIARRVFFRMPPLRVFGGGQRNNNNRLFYSTSDDDDDDDDDDEMTRCVVYLRRHRRAS